MSAMNDIELQAVAAAVNAETMVRHWENQQRDNHGYAIAYDESVAWPARDALMAELRLRGIVWEPPQ